MTIITDNDAHCLIVSSTMISIDMRRIGRCVEDEFEDIKGVINIRISKKNRQLRNQRKGTKKN